MKRNTSAAKAIVCTVVLWTIPLLLAAQRSVPKLEDLPRRAIDTLDTDDSNIKIVIFTNNTWCYYYPDLNERMDREVYREHWVNDRVFAYTDIQLKELPPVIDRLREMSPLWEMYKEGVDMKQVKWTEH